MAVYTLANGEVLDKEQFLNYFEKKVFKTIKKYQLIQKGDVVCVATSGGKDSLAVLYMTQKFCKQYDIPLFALAIDEGIHGYRDHTLDDLQAFCDRYNVSMQIVSFKDTFGKTLDQVREEAMTKFNKKPCTICGIFRRTLLNKYARYKGATKLVTGHNLDDEAQALFMNTLKGNMRHNAALGPIVGLSNNAKFVQRVKPLYFVTEQETRLFAFLKGFKVDFSECPNIGHSFRAIVRDHINAIEGKQRGSKHAMVKAFLEIMPDLKEKYKNSKEFAYCSDCGDPCSGERCNACEQVRELGLVASWEVSKEVDFKNSVK
ncbi:MAG: TIGR00269 family protein [Candidatus Woesearchaeota archaeon]